MSLRNYVIRRLLQIFVVYWVFITILFFLFRMVPGDPTSMYVIHGLSPQAREAMIARLGLDAPLHIQYFTYIQNLLTLDFGLSFTYRQPVSEVLYLRFFNTIFLMGAALIIAYFIGLLVGSMMGWKRDSSFERGGLIMALIARSSPEFWTGIVLLTVFALYLGWFPTGGIRSLDAEITTFWGRYLAWDFVWHMILPMLTGAIYFAATPLLLMRNTIIDVLDEDYIEIKEAEGFSQYRILYVHAVRNSVLPLVTIAAIMTGAAIGGSVVIETVFNWPGMGREMVRAIHAQDYPVAMGAFFLMGSVVIFMNLVADILYAYLDPRVKYD